MEFAPPRAVNPLFYLTSGLTLGALAAVAHEHRERRISERFGAAALEVLLNAIDANDRETGAHVRRVAAYAGIIADARGLTSHRRRNVERVALFHDIGKIHGALFDILHDDDALSDAERRAIASHPERGAAVLAPLRAFYPELAAGVIAHHERWDGRGYPRGLRGRRIPLSARIVAIADTFDVVTSGRPYQAERSVAEAERAILGGRGRQFDPELVDLVTLPPVFAQLRVAMYAPEARARAQARIERRTGKTREAPDVTFRWRSGAVSPRARARQR